MKAVAVVLALAFASSACSAAPRLAAGIAAHDRPGWQVMRHIKLAAFSAHDLQEYELMVFCDGATHLRLYHLVAADERAADIELRSGRVRAVMQGVRELVTVTPPPVSTGGVEVTGARISARLERSSPVWREFLRTGALEARTGAERTDASARPEERAALVSMFETCAVSGEVER